MERIDITFDTTFAVTAINQDIQQLKHGGGDANKISDGYHTFGELYEHRVALFKALCSMIIYAGSTQTLYLSSEVWKSKLHSDGSVFEGWFIAGLGVLHGQQITYHVPMSEWDTWPGEEIGKSPEFDGHTSADVLKRLAEL